MDTFEQQERIAKRRVSWPAIFKVGLGLGVYLFIFAGGTPWTGAGIANGVLGRAEPWPMPLVTIAHFSLCLVYMVILAHAIYRLNIWMAAFAGVAVGLVLYGVNYALFATHNAGDGRALSAHIVFGLFGSVLYKALSVPRVKENQGKPA